MRSFGYGGEPVFMTFVQMNPAGTGTMAVIYDVNLNPRPLLATERLVIDSIYIDATTFASNANDIYIMPGDNAPNTGYPTLWSFNGGFNGSQNFQCAGFTSAYWATGLSLPIGVYPYVFSLNDYTENNPAAFNGIGRIINNPSN